MTTTEVSTIVGRSFARIRAEGTPGASTFPTGVVRGVAFGGKLDGVGVVVTSFSFVILITDVYATRERRALVKINTHRGYAPSSLGAMRRL